MKTPLQQAARLEDRLERLHDALSEKLGMTNKLALDALHAYGLACSIAIDLEKMAESVEDE